MKILITEKIAADSIDYLRLEGFEVDECLGLSQEEIHGNFERSLVEVEPSAMKGENFIPE